MTSIFGGGGNPAADVNALMRSLGGQDIPGLEELDPRALSKLREGLQKFVDELQKIAKGDGSLQGLANGQAQQSVQQAARMASQGCCAGGAGACCGSGGVNPLAQNQVRNPAQDQIGSSVGRGGSTGNPELDALAAMGGGGYFEDRIFAIMCKVVKDMQKQIEERLNKLQAEAKKAEGGGGGGGVTGGGGGGNDGSESRNIEFEKIKMDIQKLSQMQQAMSNVLNTFDELAKSAIRHIKAG